MEIREVMESDAMELLALFQKLEVETSFMLMERGERFITLEEQTAKIASFNTEDNQLMAVAVMDGVVSGVIVVLGGTANSNRHSAHMVIGVERLHWGKGLGTSLIAFMERWAVSKSFHRIEFTVIESNVSARVLYKKCGYVEEGIKRDSLIIDGNFINESYMSKLF